MLRVSAGSTVTKDGTYYKFGVEKNSLLPLFVDTIFRPVDLVNIDGETHDDLYGIELLRFRQLTPINFEISVCDCWTGSKPKTC